MKSVLSSSNPIFPPSHTYIHTHISFDKRHWTFTFFSLFRDISLFKILFSSSPPFPIPTVFAFVFRSFCRSHLLVDISSFSPPYLRPFQFHPLFVLFFCYLCRLARLLDTTVSFSLAICSPRFNVGR